VVAPIQLGGALKNWVEDLLPGIQTPVLNIAGDHDRAVPAANSEFLHQRLPKSKLDIIDSAHFTWEDSPDEFAALLTGWWADGYAGV
jgi:pimeloyl-ACP methyl ester carboxylesterase